MLSFYGANFSGLPVPDTRAGTGKPHGEIMAARKFGWFGVETMIAEIEAKSALIPAADPRQWFGVNHTLNIYRGCEHQCIYCDSRSECYRIDDFETLAVKTNIVERLADELVRKRRKGIVGTGSMSDPYTISEGHYMLTGRALDVLAASGFGVHITTKSDMVVRDIDVLRRLARVHACVAFTITTPDDDLAAVLEPRAPRPSARLKALKALAGAGVCVGVALMPVLPFIEDRPEHIVAIADLAHRHGARFIVPWLQVTLRDRQRDYFFARLDEKLPGLSRKYRETFCGSYHCPARDANRLYGLLESRCHALGLACGMEEFFERFIEVKKSSQLALFERVGGTRPEEDETP